MLMRKRLIHTWVVQNFYKDIIYDASVFVSCRDSQFDILGKNVKFCSKSQETGKYY